MDGLDPAEQDELATENLAIAARAAAGIGATVLVEALNAYESPSYPLVSAKAAVEVVDRVGSRTWRSCATCTTWPGWARTWTR
nr:hypothetical protein GCM10020093_113530 [Planobispora longispora]